MTDFTMGSKKKNPLGPPIVSTWSHCVLDLHRSLRILSILLNTTSKGISLEDFSTVREKSLPSVLWGHFKTNLQKREEEERGERKKAGRVIIKNTQK